MGGEEAMQVEERMEVASSVLTVAVHLDARAAVLPLEQALPVDLAIGVPDGVELPKALVFTEPNGDRNIFILPPEVARGLAAALTGGIVKAGPEALTRLGLPRDGGGRGA
jgi:hypothetical protein